VKGNFLIARGLAPLAARAGAVLIHVSSGAGHITPFIGHSAYGAAKAASTRMFEHFQVDCPNIRVTSVHPGVVETEMGKKLLRVVKFLPKDDGM
jgi:NAD(P)-dependent dehydrogenase (short-subunit alcohol dehydrogenase family)